MKCFSKLLIALAAVIVSSAQADILFDNTSGTLAGGFGYFNPNAAWGDEVSLTGPGSITSFSFDLTSVFSGYGNGTLTLAIYNVDAGADGLLQTADDKVGSLIGSYSQVVSLTSSSRYTISGFSIAIPTDFVYTVTTVGNLSYVIETTKDAAGTGTSSNFNLWANFSSGLPVGTASNGTYAPTYGNNQVMFQGVAVPEPNSVYLLSMAIGLVLFFRLRALRGR